jgi:rubrerythrin
MNIYGYAMQMERDGERYYRELARKTGNAGLRNILTMLADAEIAHYRLFRNMRESVAVKVEETNILENVKNIFQELREKGLAGTDASQADLYHKALEIEKKSRDFYLEKAGEAQDESMGAAFRKIAEEEQKHYRILESIIDFVSRPEQWLEDAEWYHLEDY